ncbi:FOG: Transposon-encoded proteins with TYA, reverse transcriptase, integrase domains in various combinations [Plasmopara halstedii]|uniref:FOG: Transposon-encoded proteins with TYA, reverse transcriptase, integrase domains in various combinations n=1 Tax=Plasmopara halstedii TaxID=4781 RepID=A0A0P1A9S9_PLAHL|nr:FOG: Transposon-encoded proteins with TYA, reverse transcriptase, integrase domains in various combinations [Plasmopara halstedii]CEG37039.1 FOG: Transposon-encoded proteins with TYA, reverse transcriptase, integrase domains in various combinations [Plasmopara halstedii]|eukprot:XP_024573408.1 FOG: Transposon-encoded proteins with TYA, reverse transcriptase, integrase domains in various combinations [Plasmopara halstedii]
MKALGSIAQGVSLEHQTKIRSVTSAIQAWGTLREFYNRNTMHNRVMMTHRLHEFKIEKGATMAKHLDKFDELVELVVGLQSLGEPLDDARQLVILLSRLLSEFELISSIIENIKDVTLIEVKKKLLKEYERLEKKKTSERALKVTSDDGRGKNGKSGKRGRNNDRKGNGAKNNGGLQYKCFSCDQVGHMKRDCPNKVDGSDDGAVFAVSELSPVNGSVDSVITSAWLILHSLLARIDCRAG